jgi:hypothetical protein
MSSRVASTARATTVGDLVAPDRLLAAGDGEDRHASAARAPLVVTSSGAPGASRSRAGIVVRRSRRARLLAAAAMDVQQAGARARAAAARRAGHQAASRVISAVGTASSSPSPSIPHRTAVCPARRSRQRARGGGWQKPARHGRPATCRPARSAPAQRHRRRRRDRRARGQVRPARSERPKPRRSQATTRKRDASASTCGRQTRRSSVQPWIEQHRRPVAERLGLDRSASVPGLCGDDAAEPRES